MVDQVEVTNVGADGGSNGVASEVTLERLAETMEKMSKQQGADGAATVKKLKQLNQELESGINVSTQYQDAISENTDKVEENTEAVEESTDAHRTLADTMLGVFMGALGTVAGSLKGLTSELVFGGDQVSDFAQHMPIIGRVLEPIAGYLDDTMDTFRELRTIGGSLGNDLMEFRRSTAEMYLSMDEFTSFMKDNSESIAAYGGTVTGGIRELRLMNSALGEHREDLLNMGFTYEDMNDALSHYMYLNRTNQMVERRSSDEQAAAAAAYAKNLDRLAKLTGQDVDSMRQRIAQEQNNIAVQRELAKMTDDQRDTWNEAYASLSSFSGAAGEVMRQMLNSQGPLSESSRTLASLAPQAYSALQNFVDGIKSGDIDVRNRAEFEKAQAEAISNFLVGIDNAGHDLESVIDAVAASEGEIGGPAVNLAEILNSLGMDVAQYRDRSGKINADLIEETLRRTQSEQESRAETTEAVASFDEAIRGMRQTIKVAIIDSGVMEAFASGVDTVAGYLKSPEFQEAFSDAIERVTEFSSTMINFIREGEFSEAWDYLLGESGVLATKLQETLGNVKEWLGNALYDAFTNEKVIMAIGGGIAAAIASTAVIGGISKALGSILTGGGGKAVGGAAGGALGGLGKGAGVAIKGISSGLAAAGASAKLITLGSAAIAAAITLIGAGIAGAAWLTGKALPTLADGLERIAGLDGGNLAKAGEGLKSFGIGMAAFSGGSIAKNIGDTFGLLSDGLYSLFGKERGDPIDKLIDFASKNVDMDKVQNNAKSLVLFTETMNNLPKPKFTESVSSFFGGFFDNSDELLANLKRFSEYDINHESIGNLEGVGIKLERLTNIDPSGLRNYTSALEELVEALKDLNDEFKEGSGGLFGRSGPTIGDLIQNINNTNTASSEGMDRVSSLLSELLTVIRSDTELSRKIEKNTRSIQTTNLVRNPSSF